MWFIHANKQQRNADGELIWTEDQTGDSGEEGEEEDPEKNRLAMDLTNEGRRTRAPPPLEQRVISLSFLQLDVTPGLFID